jgi:hypothetical protein
MGRARKCGWIKLFFVPGLGALRLERAIYNHEPVIGDRRGLKPDSDFHDGFSDFI